MTKYIIDFFNKFVSTKPDLSIEEKAEYSLKRYKKTYELLEKYDKKAIRDPEELADSGRMRTYIRSLQEKARIGRADTSI